MNLSIIIPVFNGSQSIGQLTNRLIDVLSSACDNYEIILINDGSRDDSWPTIVELSKQFKCVQGIDLMRNYGQHNALLCGIRSASFEYCITMDDDLQHSPEVIPGLIDKLNEGYDVVYAKPQKEQQVKWRNLASIMTKLALQTTMGVQNASNVSPFRGFRTCLRDAFSEYKSPFVSIDVLLTWATTNFTAISVVYNPRKVGRSNYNFKRLLMHAINMITGFSVIPLQIASITGFALTSFGVLVLIYVVGRYLLTDGGVAGFPFLASIIAIFSGTQLFVLGIMGEYLARIHFRTMKRPTYVISCHTDKKINDHKDNL
jgi:glycosyltransferase involved in cell wall biosynthesis